MGLSAQALQHASKKLGEYLRPHEEGRNGRGALVRHLSGRGIELGALKDPLDLSGASEVGHILYVDQHRKHDLIRLFPELERDREQIIDPDVTCDISRGLQPFASNSLDFVVTNHLIEHLPDPIFFLREVWRVLKPGGKVYLGVPDRNFTFDRDRPLTPALHLIGDFLRRVKAVDDNHLAEFLALCDKTPLPEDPQKLAEFLESHRQRSIHVHVWDVHTFCRFLLGIVMGPCPFRVLAMSAPGDNPTREMIFVMAKTSHRNVRRLRDYPFKRMLGLAMPWRFRQAAMRAMPEAPAN